MIGDTIDKVSAVSQPSGTAVRTRVPHASRWDDRDEQSIRTSARKGGSGPPSFLFPFFQPHERSSGKQSRLGRRDRLKPHDWPTMSSAYLIPANRE